MRTTKFWLPLLEGTRSGPVMTLPTTVRVQGLSERAVRAEALLAELPALPQDSPRVQAVWRELHDIDRWSRAAQEMLARNSGQIAQFHLGMRQQYYLAGIPQMQTQRDYGDMTLVYLNQFGMEQLTVIPRIAQDFDAEFPHPLNYLIFEWEYPDGPPDPVYFKYYTERRNLDQFTLEVTGFNTVYNTLVFLKGPGLPVQPDLIPPVPGYFGTNNSTGSGSFDGFHAQVGHAAKWEYAWRSSADPAGFYYSKDVFDGGYRGDHFSTKRLTVGIDPPSISGTGLIPYANGDTGGNPGGYGWPYFDHPAEYQMPEPLIGTIEPWDLWNQFGRITTTEGLIHRVRLKGLRAHDPHEMELHIEFLAGKFREQFVGVDETYNDYVHVLEGPNRYTVTRDTSLYFTQAAFTPEAVAKQQARTHRYASLAINLLEYRRRYGNVIRFRASVFQRAAWTLRLTNTSVFGEMLFGLPATLPGLDDDTPQYSNDPDLGGAYDTDGWRDDPIPVSPGPCTLRATVLSALPNPNLRLSDMAGGYPAPAFSRTTEIITKTVTDRQTVQDDSTSPPSNAPWGELFGIVTYQIDENILSFRPEET